MEKISSITVKIVLFFLGVFVLTIFVPKVTYVYAESVGTVIVIVNVTNNSGGTAIPSNFNVRLRLASNYLIEASGSPAAGSSTGTPFSLDADLGSWHVNADSPSGYHVVSFGGDGCFADQGAQHATAIVIPGQTTTCYINIDDVSASLVVRKALIPSSDPGRFNLLIDGVVAGAGGNVGDNGSTDVVYVAPGSHTVGETASFGTNLSDYTSVISGDCATNGTITLALGETKECTITNTNSSTPTTYFMAIVIGGIGTGTVTSDENPPKINCGADCNEWYTSGTVVTLTATPNLGSTFAGWTGQGCTGTGLCIVTMDQARTFIATFDPTTPPPPTPFTLTVNKAGTGTGTVASTPVGISCGADCNEVYNSGTVVTLTATESGGSTFTGWSGSGCSGVGTCIVTMDADKIVTATFDPITPPATLTVNKVLIPSNDLGQFNLQIDGTTAGTGANVGNGGTTGAVDVSLGWHSVDETAGIGTDLSDYVYSINDDCNSEWQVNVTSGSAKVCTITNQRAAKLIVVKSVINTTGTKVPSDFPLYVENLAGGPDTLVFTGVEKAFAPGSYRVYEISDPGYTGTINLDCAASGNVTLVAGFTKVCTITNQQNIAIDNPPTADNLAITSQDNCIDSPDASYIFGWDYNDVDGDNENQFQFQISDSSNFLTTAINRIESGLNNPPGTHNSQQVNVQLTGSNSLRYGKTYYWRVKVWENDPLLPGSPGLDSGWITGSSSFATPVGPWPTAWFDFTKGVPTYHDVVFTNASVCYDGFGNPINCDSYLWNFSCYYDAGNLICDGDTSTLKDPTYSYPTFGDYIVRLRAYSGDYMCQTTRLVQIVNEDLPPDRNSNLPWWIEISPF